ncbi:hypothetical protein L1987_72156 [Smallanthus sonchifolius]|uniref:Uncharacterized protein n=1 Tax=Smallanthus sonchifolius TaxID=185202 RepID=A0ACB9AVS7_9ASTR|nr:hypothetical protein L1987_72156 [Smallanthus sonchifolius]
MFADLGHFSYAAIQSAEEISNNPTFNWPEFVGGICKEVADAALTWTQSQEELCLKSQGSIDAFQEEIKLGS